MRNLITLVITLLPLLPASDICAQPATGQELSSPPEYSDEVLNALPQEQSPLIVTASFELHNINYIDDESETFEFTGVLKLSWQDPRQAFDPVIEGINEKLYIGDYQFNEVYTGWWPQAVLLNEAGMYDKHGVMLRVKPDGSLTLLESINATAKSPLNLRRYPFDTQRLEAIFEVFGYDNNAVVLQISADTKGAVLNLDEIFRISQWNMAGFSTTIADRKTSVSGRDTATSTLVVHMDMQRQSFYTLRLVILPIMIMVILSWSVFWMEKSSVGDRMSISFIVILTVVAYLIVIGDILPRISYVTLMNSILSFGFLITCASAIINLRVSSLDRQGKSAAGDRLDRRCRWIFPLAYIGLLLLAVLVNFFLLPPP